MISYQLPKLVSSATMIGNSQDGGFNYNLCEIRLIVWDDTGYLTYQNSLVPIDFQNPGDIVTANNFIITELNTIYPGNYTGTFTFSPLPALLLTWNFTGTFTPPLINTVAMNFIIFDGSTGYPVQFSPVIK